MGHCIRLDDGWHLMQLIPSLGEPQFGDLHAYVAWSPDSWNRALQEIVEALMHGSWPESGLHNWASPKVISGYIPILPG